MQRLRRWSGLASKPGYPIVAVVAVSAMPAAVKFTKCSACRTLVRELP
ncbi:MAG: hypothetical protein JNK76_12470 [Planctomycetales bacterium]|nr:hypothetical protein [Planctomycetales bacterium]MBN8628416.1 hypothetical protein [Planctomycetota bacterium]